MATLIVDLHCMCLFVPDESTGSVHVLMPAMHGPGEHAHDDHHAPAPPAPGPEDGDKHEHEHPGGPVAKEGEGGNATGGGPAASDANGKAPEKHVVRMLHRSFTAQPQGRPMEGWGLIVDDGRGPARLEVAPAAPGVAKTEVPDLTAICKKVVDPALVSSLHPQGVVSRVTFRAGEVSEVRSNGFEWTLDNQKDRVLAHAVTWVIHNVPDQLTWVRLNGPAGPPPILSLRELAPEANDVYRIAIHHETERTLPGAKGPGLAADDIQHHFAAFYAALGMAPPSATNPQEAHLLPVLEGKGGGSILCRSAQARMTL
jgi:hypothetical protein